MRLPNFLVIGANKGGTTSLHNYLAQHPEIYMSAVKEPMFFAIEGNAALAEGNRQWGAMHRLEDYGGLFAAVTTEKAWGESSTTYLCSESVPANIARHVPGMKLIAVLRHPSERTYSHYAMNVRLGLEDLPTFEAAVRSELDGIGGPKYIQLGYYATQLERYHQYFPWDQMLVLIYRDFAAASQGVLRNIYRFLEVDDGFEADLSQRHNVAPRARPPDKAFRRLARLVGWRPRLPDAFPQALRERLIRHYGPEVHKLQDMLGRDLSYWLA